MAQDVTSEISAIFSKFQVIG